MEIALTSIVIWLNEDDYLPGLWAVSDSRVSNVNNILTDNYPKLSAIHAMSYKTEDFSRSQPRHVLSIGFAFSGSTLIGSTVREMLSIFLSTLTEIDYYDAPDLPFDEKIPSLEEIAMFASRLASKYVASLGVHYPANARIEIAIFGHCTRSNALQVFRVFNEPIAPEVVAIEHVSLNEHDLLVLGDNRSAVAETISMKRSLCGRHSLEWNRAPILALLDIAEDINFSSIGGGLQLCAAGRFGIRHLPLTKPESMQHFFVGFDLFESAPSIGGFSYNHSIGLTYPSP